MFKQSKSSQKSESRPRVESNTIVSFNIQTIWSKRLSNDYTAMQLLQLLNEEMHEKYLSSD